MGSEQFNSTFSIVDQQISDQGGTQYWSRYAKKEGGGGNWSRADKKICVSFGKYSRQVAGNIEMLLYGNFVDEMVQRQRFQGLPQWC